MSVKWFACGCACGILSLGPIKSGLKGGYFDQAFDFSLFTTPAVTGGSDHRGNPGRQSLKWAVLRG